MLHPFRRHLNLASRGLMFLLQQVLSHGEHFILWSTQQLWEDINDHGDENDRFQDHTEDQGSGSNNEDDHDHDENQDDKDEDGTTSQVEGGASGEERGTSFSSHLVERRATTS